MVINQGGGGGVTAVTASAPLAITGAPATPNVILSGSGALVGDVLVWTGAAWVPTAGMPTPGNPNALLYENPAGTTGITDPGLVAAPVDQFGRAQIRDTRLPGGVGTGAVLRQGAWQVDGDPLPDVQGEGLVVYGPAPNGLMDGSNGTFGRVKFDRFGIRLITGGFDVGYGWRTDLTEQYFKDDTGTRSMQIIRASGAATFRDVGLFVPGGASFGARWRNGNGTPEGAVVGSVGDLFTRLDGGINTTLYVKESGVATNTGWVADGVSPLSAVLAVGNTSGANDILLAPAQRLDTDVAGTLKLGTVTATGFVLGNTTTPNPAPLPGGDPMVLINQAGAQIGGSNAGIQYSTTRANRAQFRGNQFGANFAGPGITGYKSRGAAIGDAPGVGKIGVLDGDLLFRATAIGVAQNDSSTPLAALLSLQVPPNGSLPLSNYVSTELELQLVPLEGPVNGATVLFKVTSQGVPMLRETLVRPAPLPALAGVTAGLAVTGPGGTIFVPNVNVRAAVAPGVPALPPGQPAYVGTTGTRVALTIQPGGAVPTGAVWVSAITPGVGFTIQSMTGDVGVQVYWQLWEGV
jgi:hypothetical protein